MADALIGFVVEELASFIVDHIKEEVGILAGARGEVDKIAATFRKIQAVLKDAENQQVKNNSVKQWLGELKDAAYEIEDVLDEWKTKILISQIDGDVDSAGFSGSKKKVSSCFLSLFSCFTKVKLHHDTDRKIKELRQKLDLIEEEKAKFSFHSSSESEEPMKRPESSSLIDTSYIFGRDVEKKNIVKELLSESSPEHNEVYVISIIGMGGLGKTALAQLVFNDDEVTKHFENKIWVCVSELFDLNVLAAKIIEGLGDKIPATTVRQWETLHHQLLESLKNKKILLVLDDVWIEYKVVWEKIKLVLDRCLRGSRVLVTTRSKVVTITLGSSSDRNLAVLNDKDCWELFKKYAFNRRGVNDDRHRLESIGRQISDKCKGVPLSAKTLGCLMPYKKAVRDWQDVLDSDLWESEKVNKDILPALMLSYIALPLQLRHCFAYCAIFIKDHNFNRDELMKVWMSQGFIFNFSARDTEIIGEEYFDELLSRSFFQDLGINKNGEVTYKIHDLVHDFENFVSNNECSIVEGINTKYDSAKTRHLSFIFDDDESHLILPSIKNARRLRTLLFWVGQPRPQIDISLLHQLKCLRTLDLSCVAIETLPNEIGDLIHLRYLDLSETKLMELPETVSDLRNLQTLKLNSCEVLRQLPQGLGKQINLRHLEIDSTPNLKCLPRGLERLNNLQTLSKFFVSEGGCQLRELRNLNKLKGRLQIINIKGAFEEVNDAKLKDKPYLCKLELCFRGELYEGKSVHDTNTLELLEPHLNLEELTIWYYGGSKFPTWMELLTNISDLTIGNCYNLEVLPSFTSLTSLMRLQVGGLDLISPSTLFNGLEASVSIAYPNLKALVIQNMNHWEEWEMETVGDTTTIMPALQFLVIEDCPKLKSLPRQILSDSVKELLISGCPELTISFLPPFIEKMLLSGLYLISPSALFNGLEASASVAYPNLKKLTIEAIKHWEEWEMETEGDTTTIMPSLQELTIRWCPKLKSLPRRILSDSLAKLGIYGCPKLTVSHLPPFLEKLLLGEDAGSLSTSLPFINNTTLKELLIINSPHSSLPRGISQLKALQILIIENCNYILSIVEDIQLLTSLENLSIWRCPILEVDGSALSHIPQIWIDAKRIK